jgi:DNA-binding protein HU-beta
MVIRQSLRLVAPASSEKFRQILTSSVFDLMKVGRGSGHARSEPDLESKGEARLAKSISKSELIQKIVQQHPNEIARKDVKGVIDAVAEIGYKELKKTGAFFMPGLAKFVVIKRPATKAREGINPFTKEPTIFKARPARKIIKARPVKAAKDAVA